MPPYIEPTTRPQFEGLEKIRPGDVGELNFCITMLVQNYLYPKRNHLNYTVLNGAYGAMLLAAEEFRERVIKPYEQKKCKENGDVYPEWLVGKGGQDEPIPINRGETNDPNCFCHKLFSRSNE